MIAPHPKHRLPPSLRMAAHSGTPGKAGDHLGRGRRARRAAASLFFGNPVEESESRKRHSPWAVIGAWLLAMWMLVAVAYHMNWMFSKLGMGE